MAALTIVAASTVGLYVAGTTSWVWASTAACLMVGILIGALLPAGADTESHMTARNNLIAALQGAGLLVFTLAVPKSTIMILANILIIGGMGALLATSIKVLVHDPEARKWW